MAIGERIRFFRNLRGMTQKYLGLKAGLGEKTADIRMAQYEAGTRTPKEDLTNAVAGILEVSPSALTVPDFDSDIGLMHSLFYLEDVYGLTIEKDGDANGVIFTPNMQKDTGRSNLYDPVICLLTQRKPLTVFTTANGFFDLDRCGFTHKPKDTQNNE